MARKVRDADLRDRTARSRLKARGKPYYRELEPGLHLGYRRPTSGSGKWIVRHYLGNQAYAEEVIGVADDYSDADGVAIINFGQAQDKARKAMVARAHQAAGKHLGPYTVAHAMDAYLAYLDSDKKSGADARKQDTAHIRPALGHIEVAKLKADDIRKWRDSLAATPARLRTRIGEQQQYAPLNTPEAKRARKSSANRVLNYLKAALNKAWEDGKVASNAEWAGKKVKRFENVDRSRDGLLTIEDAQRLINACDGDFRVLVQAALQTGARYGSLAALKVRDFNRAAGTLAIRQSKTKTYHVTLTEEGKAFFAQVCAGRPGDAIMLLKANGQPWKQSQQSKLMRVACARASISPPIGFHGLRHTWASLAVMARMPMMVVARNLGHTDTKMVEKHYGHLAPSFVAEAIREHAPTFGFTPNKKLAVLK